MVEKILNNTTPYGKIRASHEGSLHSSTLNAHVKNLYKIMNMVPFDKSKEPKIKYKDGSHVCNSFYSVCKYCIALFFLIPLN